MEQRLPSPKPTSRTMAWGTAVVAGVAVPALLLLTLSGSPDLASVSAPAFTMALMGVGIIAAAAAGLFWVGVLLALVNTACVLVLALMLGMPTPLSLASAGLAMAIASVSFAARGALFAKTLSDRGWLMALFVVAGEGSVLLIAFGWPGVLPGWFLALLPAQWASAAIQSALTGSGALGAVPVLSALAGTAATTLLAARFWLRRWPYVLMFTTWLALSALVYFSPATVHRIGDAALAISHEGVVLRPGHFVCACPVESWRN